MEDTRHVDAREFFVEQHRIVVGVVDQLVVAGIDECDLRRQPAAEQNSLAWLLWHAARWEDVMVNTWICDQPQVFDRGQWSEKLATCTRHVGTGMTTAQVRDLSAVIDLSALREYRAAIADTTPTAPTTTSTRRGWTSSGPDTPSRGSSPS
jgi:DinB superfamily